MSKSWNVSFKTVQPEIAVARAHKYGEIREGIEEVASGNKKYMVITADDRTAKLIGQAIAQYRHKRELRDTVSYMTGKVDADGNRKVVVWNNRTTEAPIAVG